MKPRSAKQKGRKFQQEVRDKFLEFASDLEPDDVRSTSMGASGEDILFSPAARRVYPYSIECKHVEKLSIWSAIDQCLENAMQYIPAIIFRKNHRESYITVPLDHFMELISENRRLKHNEE